ncbi:MAG: cytochrome [Actinotalea sp.]|nr:cytochrome [Actinotalea sp.]
MAVSELAAQASPHLPGDLFSSLVREDPFPTFRLLREAATVQECVVGGAMTWVVTGDRAARQVLAHPDVSHWRRAPGDTGDTQDAFEGVSARWLSAVLPGHDAALRTGLTALLAAPGIERITEGHERLADHLLDLALPARRIEVVSGYATPLALMAACRLLGLDTQESGDLARAYLSDPQGTLEGVGAEDPSSPVGTAAVLQRAIAVREEVRRDGLLSLIAEACAGGRVARHDAVPFARFFLFALVDNMANLVSNAVAALVGRDDALGVLASPGATAEACVEELLRHAGPVHYVRVTALRDLEVEGVVVPAGRDVLVSLAAANRDPRRHPDPESLCPARGSRDHLAFGWGPGYCVGARLARREATLALGALARRVTSIRLPVGPGPVRARPEVLNGRTHLHLELDRRPLSSTGSAVTGTQGPGATHDSG